MVVAGVEPPDRPRPPDHHQRRNLVEAAADDLHHPVRPVRQGSARSVAGGGARRRARRRGDGVPPRLPPHHAGRRPLRRGRRRDGPADHGRTGAAGRAHRSRRPGPLGLRGFRLIQRPGVLRGLRRSAAAHQHRPTHRRQASPGLRGRLLRGARPARDLAVLGPLWPLAVLEGPRRAGARRDAGRDHADRLVPARLPGLRLVQLQRQPCDASALQQPGLRLQPVRGRAEAGRVADDAPAHQGRRRAAGRRRHRHPLAHLPSLRAGRAAHRDAVRRA